MTQTTISPEVKKLFQGKNFASFATLMNDGSPHVAPTWVDLDGDIILINTAEGRVKEKNIKRDNRIALSIYDQENPYNMASIRGKVIDITKEGADEHIDKLAKKYFGVEKYPLRSPDEQRIILKIQPEKIHHHHYHLHKNENSMFKKLPITDFEKNQIREFKKWFTELKNIFNS